MTAAVVASAIWCGTAMIGATALGTTVLAPPASAATTVIGLGGHASDPGFRGVVTSRGQQLGVAKLGNGTYGVCFDTGASHPWPSGTPASSLKTNPRVGYLLSTYMARAKTDARYAAALWWATGLDLGTNRYPTLMRASINQMKADSPSTYAAVKSLHDKMLAEAVSSAAGQRGYDTSALKVSYAGPTTTVGRASGAGTVSGVGVRSGAGHWLAGHPVTVTLSGATFTGTTSRVWTGTTTTPARSLGYVQTGPGAVTATMRVGGLADHHYRLHDAHNQTQRVGVSAGLVSAGRTAQAAAPLAYVRARKVDVATGAALAGALFTVWVDANGDRSASAAESPASLSSSTTGYTPVMSTFRGAQVCFRETKAPGGYAVSPTVACVAATGTSAAPATVVVRDNRLPQVPVLSTQVNHQVATVGTVLQDAVKVTNTAGARVTGQWRLLGPVNPVTGACTHVSWAKAPTAASGTFTATGDGTYQVGRHTVTKPGCYTYTEALSASPTTEQAPWTTPGVPAETTLVKARPTLSTQVNHQVATVGAALVDQVWVGGSGGAAVNGSWRLLGPIAPQGTSCAGLSWAGAPAAASGAFVVRGDGTYQVGRHTVTEAGCYTYVETLTASPTTAETGWTRPGITSETSAVRPRPVLVPAHPTVTAGGHGRLPAMLGRATAPARIQVSRVGLDTTLSPTRFRGAELVPPGDIRIGGVWADGAALDAVAGTSVVVGHVSDNHDRPGAFRRLWGVRPGTTITTRERGVTTTWRVTTVDKVAKGHLSRTLFTQGLARRLVLITCANRVTHGAYFHYTANEVIVAVPVRR